MPAGRKKKDMSKGKFAIKAIVELEVNAKNREDAVKVASEKLTLAKKISKKYKFPLIKKWSGFKTFWHVWHTPFLVYLLTYENYIDRIIEIEECKPQKEKKYRYKLMKPVLSEFPKNDASPKWYDARSWYDAGVKWYNASSKWHDASSKEIESAHNKECGGCSWDGHKIPEFD